MSVEGLTAGEGSQYFSPYVQHPAELQKLLSVPRAARALARHNQRQGEICKPVSAGMQMTGHWWNGHSAC